MKVFKDRITLNRNSRGCYILDTIKGCSICAAYKPLGCYDNCYAKNIADRYGMDFGNPVKRDFERDQQQLSLFGFQDTEHIGEIIRAIRSIEMPFVRIGEMGDPSEDWEHTVTVCEQIAPAGKPIVIITKHWTALTVAQMLRLSRLNVCINTSISALDTRGEWQHRFAQYQRLQPVCRSVLRVVSCDFNIAHENGKRLADLQATFLAEPRSIDTVFRPSPKNPLVASGLIKIERVEFLRAKVWASMAYKSAYMGRCETCPDMCGIALT